MPEDKSYFCIYIWQLEKDAVGAGGGGGGREAVLRRMPLVLRCISASETKTTTVVDTLIEMAGDKKGGRGSMAKYLLLQVGSARVLGVLKIQKITIK